MVIMNLLNNLFNAEDMEIVSVNKKYVVITTVFLVFISLLLMIKKDNYYVNNFSIIENEINLIVEKEYINRIKKSNIIIISGVESKYSINSIMPIENNFLVNIKLDTIENITMGEYKIYLGKERLFDYIIKVIRK